MEKVSKWRGNQGMWGRRLYLQCGRRLGALNNDQSGAGRGQFCRTEALGSTGGGKAMSTLLGA